MQNTKGYSQLGVPKTDVFGASNAYNSPVYKKDYSQYKPYTDSDTETDSDSEYSSDSDYDNVENFTSTTVQLPVPPNPADLYRKIVINTQEFDNFALQSSKQQIATFDMSGVSKDATFNQIKNTKLAVQTRSQTTTIMVTSDDRDRRAFPQPTQVTLHLPRLYRNVTSIDITQIKLLTSFLYFRDAKYNTFFNVYEQERIKVNDSSQNNIIQVKIREGSYNIDTLLSELTKQMNKTPIFFDYPNGFDDFSRIFPTNGDLGLNFNQPGDFFYDSLIDKFIDAPNINYIVTRYFQSRYAGLVNYNINQILNAYYYPVLKEAFLDPVAILSINTDVSAASGLSVGDIYKNVVFGFKGLDDLLTYELIKLNQAFLDDYRQRNTFHYSLINKYDWSYDRFNNRITVSSSNLNTSIIRYITNITNQYSNDALKDISYTSQQYTSLITQRNQSAAVITDMYNYFQSRLASDFAVNFGSYSLQQLADPSHIVYVQNAQDVSGVFTQYSLDYFNATADGRVKIPPNFSEKSPPQNPKWKLDTLASVYNTSDFNMGIKNNPYDFTLSNQIITNTFFVDPSSYIINTANLTQTNNIVVNIPSTKYAVFKFRSDVRQTIQVETLSKPLFFRYPEYNSNFGGAIPYFYNTPYSFNDISAADVSDISINVISTVFGSTAITAIPISNILTTTPLSSTRVNSIQFYTFTAPDISGIPLLPDSSGAIYTVNINIFTALPTFTAPITAFIYHDRSAFMADVNNIRSESQLNYISTITSSASSSITIPLRVHTGDKYYIILRSLEQSIPDIPYSIKIYWPTTAVTQLIIGFEGDPLQTESFAFQDPKLYLERYQNDASMNYYIARTYDPAFIRIPLSDASGINVQGVNPSDDIFALTFPPGASPIGYDSSGVSNDLTDYIVFDVNTKDLIHTPSNNGRILQDPHTEYIFQYFSPYSTSNTSYFYPSSINFLSLPNTSARLPYTYGTAPAKREYKIVHYHDTHFFAPHSAEVPADITDICSQIVMANRNVYDDLSGADLSASYNYSLNTVFNKNVLQLGQGICGITFVPPEGWWDITSFTFKSANYKHSSENPNELIEYIGIYPLRAVSGKNSVTIALEDSLIVLQIHDSHHYAPGGPNPTVDPKYGSYYVFNRINVDDNIINYNRPDIVNQGFAGYTPYPGKLINSEDDLYTLIAFDASKNIMPFHMLAGSLVPRPDISGGDFTVSTTYNGDSVPTNTVMITPSGSPYESQYQQSLPIGTQVLNYFNLADSFKDSEGFYKYDAGLLTGDINFRLRSTGYINAGSYYYLTGNISGNDLRGDVYKVINPGSEPRSSIYINQFNLSGIPINHRLVWWTSTTTTAYAVAKDVSSTTCNIYTFNPLVTNPSIIFDMSFLAVDSSGNSFDLSSATKHRFYFTNNGSFLLYGTVNNGAKQSALFYHKPSSTVSSFFGTSTETIIDAHVHCEEILQYHILTNISGQGKTLYDISQGISTPIPIKTRISPLFGEGLYSMRVNSYGTPYFLTTDYNNRYASITSREPLDVSATGYNLDARMEVNAQSLPYEISPLKTEWQIGAANSIFIQTQISTVITEPPWGIVGNTQLNGDRKYGIYNAWQVFYPVMKIILNKRANIYNSLVNRVDINQPVSEKVIPEPYRTNMFFYKNYTTLLSDLCGSTGWKWGMESNYTSADQSFRGYEFNSYIYNINVQPSPSVSSNSDDFYYLAIRGYLPSEDFQTLVRWRLPNRYDFGQIGLNTIISEISDSIINSSNYNPNYSKQLSTFNTAFSINKTFGANSLSNFPGSNYTFNGFSNFHSTFTSIYNTYSTASATISQVNTSITSNVLSNMQIYFKNILPDSYFSRINLGSSIPYDLLFKSSIPNIGALQTLDQEWGIGWNLGFDKKDYTDNTVYTAPSFFKILDDYIYLRINEEFQGMNNIDSTGKENFNETHESRGAINQYNGKLLLSAFGSYSQTMIKNPIFFNPPIGKLDRLKFTWMDSKGQVIDNTDCDWSLAVNITENVERATADSSLIQGKI